MWHAKQMIYVLGSTIMAVIAMSAESGIAQRDPDPNAAPNPYRVDEGWAKLPQARTWGAAIGVDIARDGKSV